MRTVQSPSRRQLLAAAGAGLVPNALAIWLTSPKMVRAMNTKRGTETGRDTRAAIKHQGHLKKEGMGGQMAMAVHPPFK